MPLRLMFSVYIADRMHTPGAVTRHRSLMSTRGHCRWLMYFILDPMRNVAGAGGPNNIVFGLHPFVDQR